MERLERLNEMLHLTTLISIKKLIINITNGLCSLACKNHMAFLSPFWTFLQYSNIFILTAPADSLRVCLRALFMKAVSLSLAQPPLCLSTSVCSLILLIPNFQQHCIFIDWPRRFVTTSKCFLSLFFYLQLVFILYIEILLTCTLPSLLIHQQRSDFLTSGLENAKNMDVGGCSANFSIIRMNTRL